MVSSELGACEWFVWDLRRSGLIDRGQLDQVIGEFLKRNPRAEPPALAEYLVGQEILSPFQSERILSGKTQGLVLGPYVLIDSIGAGSMGQVYKASSKTDNQWYAVKVLPRRSMWNVRLARRQVRSFSQFSHPGVVPFVDVGTSGGLHYLVWPYVSGETLEQKVERNGKLKPDAVAKIALHLAQALTVCHQNGIFHGLIKPSNIMIGNDGQTKLLDFGIGSLLAENEGESLVDTMSTANTLTSGLDCSSPESIMEPTNRTLPGDQYSLGCVLYYALTGHYPFPDGTAVEKMMAHQFKQPTSLRELTKGVPEGIIEVIERLMQKAPEARYNGADELVDAIQPFVEDSMMIAAPAAPGGLGSRSKSVPKLNDGQAGRTPMPAGSLSRPPGTPGMGTPPAHTPVAPSAAVGGVGRGFSSPGMPKAPSPGTTSKAPLPTRRSVTPSPAGSAPNVGDSAPSLPNNSATPTTPSRAHSSAPGWVPEEQSKGGFGPLFIIAVGVAVFLAVLLLGRNFLFPNS